jgi:hypothetical protein
MNALPVKRVDFSAPKGRLSIIRLGAVLITDIISFISKQERMLINVILGMLLIIICFVSKL